MRGCIGFALLSNYKVFMSIIKKKVVILGVTESGELFRPSDWAERVSGVLSTFRKHRMHYSPLLQPSTRHGYRCILLDPELQVTKPDLYNSIMKFAITNQLRVRQEDIEVDFESESDLADDT